jgi:hypothetical protein
MSCSCGHSRSSPPACTVDRACVRCVPSRSAEARSVVRRRQAVVRSRIADGSGDVGRNLACVTTYEQQVVTSSPSTRKPSRPPVWSRPAVPSPCLENLVLHSEASEVAPRRLPALSDTVEDRATLPVRSRPSSAGKGEHGPETVASGDDDFEVRNILSHEWRAIADTKVSSLHPRSVHSRARR